jgi:hypothetical protein
MSYHPNLRFIESGVVDIDDLSNITETTYEARLFGDSTSVQGTLPFVLAAGENISGRMIAYKSNLDWTQELHVTNPFDYTGIYTRIYRDAEKIWTDWRKTVGTRDGALDELVVDSGTAGKSGVTLKNLNLSTTKEPLSAYVGVDSEGNLVTSPNQSFDDQVLDVNTTRTLSSWNSLINIGRTSLTSNITITLPNPNGNVGKKIRLFRWQPGTQTVTLAAFSGSTLVLNNNGSELNYKNGYIELEVVDNTTVRQVSSYPFMVNASLASAAISSNINRLTFSGLSFNVEAGRRYRLKIVGTYHATTTAAGISLGWVGTGSTAGTLAGSVSVQTNTNGTNSQLVFSAIGTTNTVAGSFITAPAVGTANTALGIYSEAIFVCTASGTIEPQLATTAASVAVQLNPGTTISVQPIN